MYSFNAHHEKNVYKIPKIERRRERERERRKTGGGTKTHTTVKVC